MVHNENNETQPKTKTCYQCNKVGTRDAFAKKNWKKLNPSCRLCAEFTKISQDKSRICKKCQQELPRIQFDIHQWAKGDDALCHSCRDAFTNQAISSVTTTTRSSSTLQELPDGTCVCSQHLMECCDICMMDFTLTNEFTRKRHLLGRDLKQAEMEQVIQDYNKSNGVLEINRKICIMDGHPVCPRSSQKMRCPCEEVTYCSKACQKHHWVIHKMTCKVHAENMEKKAKKKKKEENEENKKKKKGKALTSASFTGAPGAADLTEEQKNFARQEAFFAENSGGKYSIEECAWQLGEHPLVIGGGTITIDSKTLREEFVKGDVAKIYKEHKGVEWDGSPRFGLPPYVQRKTPEDWIAKARQGKSQRMKNLENEMKKMLKNS